MHTTISMIARGLVGLCALVAVAAPGPAFAAQRSRGGEVDRWAGRELPDQPPAAAERQPRNNPLARTPAAVVLRGQYVSVQVNIDQAGQNILGDAANEPSIAIDPTQSDRIVIGWRQFDDAATSNFRQAGWGYSHDGGQNWIFPGVLEPGVFRSDPVLEADLQGNFYYYSLTTDPEFRCDLFKSVDGGLSWFGPVFGFGGDKQWMAIDRTDGIGQGHIYGNWTPGQFTRSTDNGLSFMEPISIPGGAVWGTIAVAPDGKVFIAGVDQAGSQNANFWVVRSSNAQDMTAALTFDQVVPVNMGGVLMHGYSTSPNPDGLLGQTWIRVNHAQGPHHGEVYVLCSVDRPGPDPLDVMFVRSTNGGQSWSQPLRINDDAAGSNAFQWFGTMGVAPNGRIDVFWNDTRNSGAPNLSELYYANSTDGGSTWTQNVPVSPMFDSWVGWPQQNKIGDYYDVVSENEGPRLAYAATFNGEQDVYFLHIDLGDCNNNGVDDVDDLLQRTSVDCNDNGVPDECEVDCNGNNVHDQCDIAGGGSSDEDGNGVPDECHGILHVPLEYATIQAAIDAAQLDDTVLVAAGTYVGAGNNNLDFGGKRLLLKGGSGPQACIIDCQRSGRGFIFQNAENRSAVVEGFTVLNGQADKGAAVMCGPGSDPTLRDCIFMNNFASNRGGAIHCTSSSPRITRCRFAGNAADGLRGGGGIYSDGTPLGIGPVIDNCLFVGNAAVNGGAIYAVQSNVTIRHCTVVANMADSEGGGLFATATSSLTVSQSIFWDNDAPSAIHLDSYFSDLVAEYSTITGGVAGVTGPGSLLWGSGNLDTDPQFADPGGEDNDPATIFDNNYRLSAGSPCIDAGDPSFTPLEQETDLDGLPRVVAFAAGDPIADMGAYEKQPCSTDLSGDDQVGPEDLATLLGAWGPNPDHPADFDHDGIVGAPDLAQLLAVWGPCG